jgi:enediyne biosynthesis protein E4
MNSKYIGIFVILSLVITKLIISNDKKETNNKPRKAHSINQEYKLTEQSKLLGINFTHQGPEHHKSINNVTSMINGFGASASVFDYNNDGFMDFFLTSSKRNGKNHLYLNTGEGKFQNIAKKVNLSDINKDYPPLKSLFFDFDNDGDQDLYLNTVYCDKLFRNDNGAYVDITSTSGIAECSFSMASNVWDFDLDGDLDLVTASYYKPFNIYDPKIKNFMPQSMIHAKNGGTISVYENKGDGVFEKVQKNMGFNSDRFVFVLSFADFRNTNSRDLWIGIDFNSDKIFFEESPKIYKDISKKMLRTPARHSMNGEIEYIDNGLYPYIHISQVYLPKINNFSNQLWKWTPERDMFIDYSSKKGENKCGWSWGGKFIDINNDGEFELVVGNGFISSGKKIDHKEYWYHGSVIAKLTAKKMEDVSFWYPMEGYSQGGFQKNCLFVKNKKGLFEKRNNPEGVNLNNYDARSVTMIDYQNNGKNDLIISNQNQKVEFLKNDSTNNNQWIGFSLQGTTSNRDAIGAKVKIYLDDIVKTKMKFPSNGFVTQNDPRIHFGLNINQKIKKVEIIWPNKKIQTINNFKMNQYNKIVEL